MNLNDLLESLNLDNNINLEDIPELDLYMDQVIQLFENKLGGNKRFEEDKILTKTMINNYAKYSKEHIILMCFIYNMKGILALSDIKLALGDIVEGYNKEEFNSEDIRKLYKIYLKGQEKNIEDIKQEINIDLNNLGEEFNSLESSEKKLLLSAMLVDKANIYKKLAEKILDSE